VRRTCPSIRWCSCRVDVNQRQYRVDRLFVLFRYVSDQQLWTRNHVRHLRLPTLDFSNPQLESLVRGVEFLRCIRQERRTAYIHCKAGRQRSANLAACYLIDTYGVTPDEAARRIQSIRPCTIFGQREIQRLHDFVHYLRKENDKRSSDSIKYV
jgi:protein-tyrosine phosphatase